ncbi:Hypothetical protein, putative [Bodo saltans]|uniref:Uncharacterized protein n=1 Tax=Bodo saltans TaxID=75058 RepID=A0A0S4J827_BODSA|nr:Hypothetical protein, putative [Bodo saltans]|eukprot:CUG87388.1 Hypothetical protein, putative [Bodo saltans]
MRSTVKHDTNKALGAAAAAQRLARILPNDSLSMLKTSDSSVLEEILLLSACRNTTLRGGSSANQPFLNEGRSSNIPRFVCCRFNCESTEHHLYRSSISGAVQGVLGGAVPSLDEAQRDEEFVAGWLQTHSSVSNSSVTAQRKLVDDPTWSNRAECLHRLEMRLNQLLQVYCGRYSDADEPSSSMCGASAFVSHHKRRAAKETETDHATLQVDVVLLYVSSPLQSDTDRHVSLFQEGWGDASKASVSSSSSFSTHHEFELQFFSTKNTMVLHHHCEVQLLSGPLPCASYMSTSHSWSLRDHRRPESHAYQDQRMLSSEQSKESLDPINTMQVDRVSESILNAMQNAENLAIQDAVDSKTPFVVKQAFVPPRKDSAPADAVV